MCPPWPPTCEARRLDRLKSSETILRREFVLRDRDPMMLESASKVHATLAIGGISNTRGGGDSV
jgi:hypothetical protein